MSRKQAFIDALCNYCDDDSHGYDQAHRDGCPDFDCSSLIYTCARDAGYDVPSWNGSTHTLQQHFSAAGWHFEPYLGEDLYSIPGGCIMLKDGHVEGVIDYGEWGGAHENELGDITGGESGDQTGREVGRCNPYRSNWKWIGYPPSEGSEEFVPAENEVQYRVYTDHWLSYMLGQKDSSPCKDDFAGIYGHVITYIEIQDCTFQVCTLEDGWLPLSDNVAGNGNPIIAVRIPDCSFHYQVHPMEWNTGRWCADMIGTCDTSACGDDYAGIMTPIDAIRCWR